MKAHKMLPGSEQRKMAAGKEVWSDEWEIN